MIQFDFLGVAPFVVLTSLVTWGGTVWAYHDKASREKEDRGDRLEIHRDKLMFDLLQNARQEMAAAHVEVENLRDEVKELRAMEQHFYHFHQALDHLEALLFPESAEARANAERNARAFLNRMRRLNEAKGAIANETQRRSSAINLSADEGVDDAR